MNYTQLAGQFIGQHHNPELIRKRLQERPQIHVLHAQTGNLLSVLDNKGDNIFWDSNHIRKLENNEERLSFTTLPDNECAEYLRERNRVVIPDGDGYYREFIIVESVQQMDQLQIECVASYVDLGKEKPLEPNLYEGQTVNTIMDLVLQATSWQRGITEYSGSRQFELEDYTNPYDALRKIVSTFEVELRFRIETLGGRVIGRYVDAIERVGGWHGREIVSGVDLISAERRENTTELVTALVGLGPQKEDGTRVKVEVTNDEAYQNWGEGEHLWGIHEVESDNQEMTEAEVRQYTTTELNKRIAAAIQYKVEGANLEHLPEFKNKEIHLGDDVRIKATEFNPPMYLDARIIAIEGPIDDRRQEVYTLGEFIEYTEAEINALRKQFKKLLAKKLEYEQLEEFTYDKSEIEQLDTNVKGYADTQDTEVYQDSTLYTDQQKQNLTNEIEGGEVALPAGSISGAIELANTTLENASSTIYTDTDGNLYFIDPADSNNVVKITSEGIGVSDTGLNGSFESVLTAKGLNISAVYTGILAANYIQVGGEDDGVLTFYDANGIPYAEFDKSGSSIGKLYVGELSGGNVITTNYESKTLYVADTGSDDNDGLTSATAFRTLSKAYESIPLYNEGDITIKQETRMVEDLTISSYLGKGYITLDLQGNELVGKVVVNSCFNVIRIENGTITQSGQGSTFYAYLCNYVIADNLTVYTNNGGDWSVLADNGTNMACTNVEVHGPLRGGIGARNMSQVTVTNCTGYSPEFGVDVFKAVLFADGTCPNGGISNTNAFSGGRIFGQFSNGSGTDEPAQPPSEQIGSWSAQDSGTYALDDNVWDSTTSEAIQGQWNQYGPYKGAWFFGSGPSNTVTGKNVTRVRIRFNRNPSGYSSAVPVVLRTHGYTSQPAGEPSLSSSGHQVDLPWGDSGWIELPFQTAFEDGSAKGLGVYVTNPANTNYATLSGNATLEITYA